MAQTGNCIGELAELAELAMNCKIWSAGAVFARNLPSKKAAHFPFALPLILCLADVMHALIQ